MALQDRIEAIKPIFRGFNIDAKEGVSVLLVKFPSGWQIPDSTVDTFGVHIETYKEGVYFMSEIESGIDSLFDAVDFVMNFNQSIIEKGEILKEKIEELKKLFVSEPVERLKSLRFVFGDEMIETIEKKPAKVSRRTADKKTKAAPVAEEETVTEVPEAPAASVVEKSDNNDDNDLMSLAKGMTN